MVKVRYKLTAIEPTDEMISAGVNAWVNQENPNKPINFVEIFKAMQQASPLIQEEPVDYQSRVRMLPDGEFDEWVSCRKTHYEKLKDNPIEDGWEWEIRALYTHPR